MGYSPWGHKESDMTEQLTLTLMIRGHQREHCAYTGTSQGKQANACLLSKITQT